MSFSFENLWPFIKRRFLSANIPLICALLFVFAVSFFATNHYTLDAQGCLLQSQSLIDSGSIKLDKYAPEGYMFKKAENGHTYYYFPIGTSLYATPAVFVANLFGLDMTNQHDETKVLRFLAALSCLLVFWIIYQLAKLFVSERKAIFFALIFFLGSTLVSTMGTTLWSINLSAFFSACALFLITRKELHNQSFSPGALAFLLFSAYLCRPTASLLIVLVSAYVLIKSREALLKYVLWFTLFGSVFMCFSYLEYHTYLPPYYSSGRLSLSDGFGLALYGNLLSPSRGFLVFNPFVLLVPLLIIFILRNVYRNLLFVLMLLWPIGHFAIVSMFHNWWGGHSYGPRLLVEAVVPFVVVVLFICRALEQKKTKVYHTIFITLFAILGAAGIFINSYQGLYNTKCYEWLLLPNVDKYPDTLYDWRCPQFLADVEILSYKQKKYLSFDHAILDDKITLLFNGKDMQTQVFDPGHAITVEYKFDGKFKGDVYIKVVRNDDELWQTNYLRPNGHLLPYRMPLYNNVELPGGTLNKAATFTGVRGGYKITLYLTPSELGIPPLKSKTYQVVFAQSADDIISHSFIAMANPDITSRAKLQFSVINNKVASASQLKYDVYFTVVPRSNTDIFICLKPDSSFGTEGNAFPFARNYAPVTGEQKYEAQIPDTWKPGKYSLYLFYVTPGADPLKQSNWGYNTFTEFNIVK